MNNTKDLLKKYLGNALISPEMKCRPVFLNKYNGKLTRAGISYILNKYAKKASRDLRALGVPADKIFTMEGGMKAWEAANYPLVKHYYASADTVFSKLKDANSVVLDARKAADYDAGHIVGAVSADVDGAVSGSDKSAAAANVKAVVDKYGKDKNYYVICYFGNRYARSNSVLERQWC